MLNREQPPARRIAIAALCLAAILVFGLLAALFVRFEQPYGSEQTKLLYDGWTVQTDARSEPVPAEDLRQYIPLEPDEVIVLRRVMSEDIKDAALSIIGSQQWIHIYLDDELIFDNTTELSGQNPGKAIYLLPLPAGYAGKELRIEASSPYELYAYSPYPPRLGDMESLRAYRVGYSVRGVVIAFILMASGVLFLLFSLFVTVKYPETIQWGNFFFGVFSILLGLVVLGDWDIWSLLFSPAAAGDFDIIVWIVYPAPLLVWVLSQCRRCKMPMRILLSAYFACMTTIIFIVITGAWDLPDALVLINTVIITITIVTAFLFAVECFDENKTLQFLTPALIPLVLSAVLSAIDIGGFYYAKEALRVVGLLSLVGLMWIYHLREYLTRRKEEQKNVQMLAVRQSLAAASLDAANRYIRESGTARHEFHHHLTVLKVLSDENDAEGLARYLEKLTAAESDPESVLYCENVLVNAILCKYAADCQIDEIRLDCDMLVEKELPFAENDLCTLLMNLMDNALEACRKLPAGKRWIRLQIRKKERFLVIACENSYDGTISQKESGVYATTKPDQHMHGFGIPAMREIAEKYESTLSIHFDSTTFRVTTALRFP